MDAIVYSLKAWFWHRWLETCDNERRPVRLPPHTVLLWSHHVATTAAVWGLGSVILL